MVGTVPDTPPDTPPAAGHLGFYTRASNQATLTSERMRITDVGNVGIGTQTPARMLDVVGGTIGITHANWASLYLNSPRECYIEFTRTNQVNPAAAQVWQVGFTDASNRNWCVWSGATDGANVAGNKLEVTPSGRVGIGVTAPAYQLQLSTDSAAKPGTNTWAIASDPRLKRNEQPFAGGLHTIRRLIPMVAEYNGKAGTPEGLRVVSLDPEKLSRLLPHAVDRVRMELDGEETDVMTINTHEVFYALLNAVKQLDDRLKKLEDE
jgi:hypothetical protein